MGEIETRIATAITMGRGGLSMTKFLTDLTQRRTCNNRLGRLSLPRGESFLSLRNPRFVYGGERLVHHLHKQSFSNRSRSVAGNFRACFSRANARAVIAFLLEQNVSGGNATRFIWSVQRRSKRRMLAAALQIHVPRTSSESDQWFLEPSALPNIFLPS